MILFVNLFLDSPDMTARIKEDNNVRYVNCYYIVQYGKVIHIKDLDLEGNFDSYFSNSEEAKKTIEEQKKDLSVLWNYNSDLIKSFQKKEGISCFLKSFIKKKNLLERIKTLEEEDTFEEMVDFYEEYPKKSNLIDFYMDIIRDNMKIQKKITESVDWTITNDRNDNRHQKLERLRSEKKLFFDKIL